MKKFLVNAKSSVLLPITMLLVASCSVDKERIAELTAEKISIEKSISRLKTKRDSVVFAEVRKDDEAYFGVANRQELDSLHKDNCRLYNETLKNYINRVYSNHKLKHYFKPSEIKQIIVWMADRGHDNITGDTPMYYLNHLNYLLTDTTAKFTTPFIFEKEGGDIIYLNDVIGAKMEKLEARVSDCNMLWAEDNLEIATKQRYDAECQKIKDKKDKLEMDMDSGLIESDAEYEKAFNTLDQYERELQKLFNKYYVKDVKTGSVTARIVLSLREKNKGVEVYGFDPINFTIPEFAAIKNKMQYNGKRLEKLVNANKRANRIKNKVASSYDVRIANLAQRRDSVERLIINKNRKSY